MKENSNIIRLNDNHVAIINGGDPIDDCPINWEDAIDIEKNFLNKGIIDEYGNPIHYKNPKWKFDCGYKLDFDGSLICVSSRFYPPKTHYGEGWDGTVYITLFDKDLTKKNFKTDTLKELKKEVDEYIDSILLKLKEIKFD